MTNQAKYDWYEQYATFKHLYKMLDDEERTIVSNYLRMVRDTPTLFVLENGLACDLAIALWSEGYDVSKVFTPGPYMSESEVTQNSEGDYQIPWDIRDALGWETEIEGDDYDY